MKSLWIFILLLISPNCLASFSQLNLGFENIIGTKAVGWSNFGDSDNYVVLIENKIVRNGKFSASIEYSGNKPGFKVWSYSLPVVHKGKSVKLTGFIKTENINEGYAGLWMRIDPDVGFNNMKNQGVTGTSDWKKYEITLDLKTSQANRILIGGLLVGKGKVWIDELELFIDGIPIEKAPLKKLALAAKDKEFDNGSKIVKPKLNKDTIDNLELLGKIWGFLKYHHPLIAGGKVNWDYELFRVLPKYLDSQSRSNRDKVLLKWIESLGDVRSCHECKKINEKAFLKPDLFWVDQYRVSNKIKDKLNYIYSNRHQGEQYYIGITQVGNPKFKNENPYSTMLFPDVGFRLLSLYKYWNIIQYYFPYKYLIEKKWANVLNEYIVKFIIAKDELEYEMAVLKLVGEIQDTHANVWGGGNELERWKGKFFPPIHTQFIENKLVVTDYYTNKIEENNVIEKVTGIKIGDVITHINNKPVESLVNKRLDLYPASNYSVKLRDIAPDLLRSTTKFIKINYISETGAKSKQLELFERSELSIFRWYRRNEGGKSYAMLNNNIGYVNLKNINNGDIPKIKKDLIKAKGIIIDIRNYPSAFVPYSLGAFFTNKRVPFVKFLKTNLNNPGEFVFTAPLEISPIKDVYQGKLVLLVNELTQSQAEFTSMAFKVGRNTTIIGSTTAGADGNVSSFYLPGNLMTMISGVGVYYPDGGETQKVGIIPDITVLPTIEGIRLGKDELLEKAINLINSE